MTLLSVTHEESARSTLAGVALRALARSFLAWRQQRARRLAMLSLLDMDAYRLDDLGITLEAVRDAIDVR